MAMTQRQMEFDPFGSFVQPGWYLNPATNQKIYVLEGFMEDSGYGQQIKIKLNGGQIINKETFDQYIPCEAPSNPNPPVINPSYNPTQTQEEAGISMRMSEPAQEQLPNGALKPLQESYMDPEDAALCGMPGVSGSIPNRTMQSQSAPTVQNIDLAMVEKVLGRKELPKINIALEWKVPPTKQLDILVDGLGVDPFTVVEYYMSKLDLNHIREQLMQSIIESINNLVPGQQIEQEPINSSPEPQPTKSKKQSKSKAKKS